MITKFDINRFEIQSNKAILGEYSGMDDHFDICCVFEISKFDIARLTCIKVMKYRKILIIYSTTKETHQSLFRAIMVK